MPQSNDDLGFDGYVSAYIKNIDALNQARITPTYIFSGFCPTKEAVNLSNDLLRKLYSKDQYTYSHWVQMVWSCKIATEWNSAILLKLSKSENSAIDAKYSYA